MKPSPEDTLSAIFAEFARRRRSEKAAAWRYLQTALAEHAGTLCPSAVSLKDIIAAEANIEDMLKGSEGVTGRTAAEELRDWLSGKSPAREVLQ